ncbi:MAG TPA: long-chain fatty acid--CoA ligase [Thermoanaerobaculia bacterium]|nr:long-chain fatty acid--CoA ligase [Thermoanaerobaculia bacterium]
MSDTRPWHAHYDYWVRPQLNYPRRPLTDILRMAAADVPDKPAVAFFGQQLTFAQIKERADKFATALARTGVVQGDRVGVMLPNCPQYIVAVFGILRVGAIVVNINPLYTPREVRVVAEDSGMKALIVLDLLVPQTDGTNIPKIVTSFVAPASFEEMIANVETPQLPRVHIDADDVAVLQYTGGTTGTPKGAMLTHYNIFANVVQSTTLHVPSLRRGEERYLLVIPFFHIYGFTVGLMAGTWLGAMQILLPKYDVDALLNAVRDHRPTYFPAVPTIFISLLNHPKSREYGIDKIRAFNSGSAPLPLEVLEQFEQLTGGMLSEGYGLSEASPVTHNSPSLSVRKPGSVGIPLPGTDQKVVDLNEGTTEVPVGGEGELCIAGPQVMKGYWNRPEETASTIRTDANGTRWLYTGDIARVDEDGFTYIVQRKKDMIIVSGFNVYPGEIESVLFTHPSVMEAVVIGVPDAYRGEAVKAFVVCKSGMSATVEDLKAHCAKDLAEFKRPTLIEIRESLPKSAVGKILRRVLREE